MNNLSNANSQLVGKSDLVLCVPKGWDSYISCEFFELHQQLVSLGWVKLVIDEVSDLDILHSIENARVVLLWEAYEFIERNEAVLFQSSLASSKKIKRIFFCDDPHFFNLQRRAQRLRAFNWADLLLATYPDKLLQWYPEISPLKIKWTPHSAASCFNPVFSPALNRVLLSGSRTWPYPFRQFCQLKLPADICEVVDHPGYPGYPGDVNNKSMTNQSHMNIVAREQYAHLLQRYPAMLVCGSIFNYLVAKVFEGMAAGCLVLCDRSSLSERLSLLGFMEGEHYIGTDILHVTEDAQTVINMYLHDRKTWKKITENAAQKVQCEHTTAIRGAEIHRLCAN